jgi:hypothetical protein
MSVDLDGDVIRLSGACGVQDAEALLALVQFDRQRSVDISDATYLHAALVQVLLAFKPPVSGSSADPFITAWLAVILGHSIAP